MNILKNLQYYFWASFQRKYLDAIQHTYRSVYSGIVLDIGGRDRGKFKKPKESVEKWIFADICSEYHPDIVLNIESMPEIANASIDTIVAIQVFAHVKNLDRGLDECFRILKKGGKLIFSAHLVYPIVNDPSDYRRYTAAGWKTELEKRGFSLLVTEKLGGYFSVMGDFIIMANKSMPRIPRYFGYLFYPLLSLMTHLDNTRCVSKNNRLSSFTTGYFIIAEK